MAHKKHKFHSTYIEHHSDSSHTIHHKHEDPKHDVKHAVANLDGLQDSMQSNLGAPNPGEAQADMGQHGVPAPQAQAAGLPAGAPPAGM